ncbi:syntaxin-12 [Sitodiplosis mosellana]|uniref:syntaxin-12 n=1 Tax=Sitodiplosis mosellana TaxID=263140 RepID=UPI0024440D4B|nr:syntaxin-12 [Sitodiplosis mosellana]XP_055303629.1 syntaxin-12 [Sitodiplosis mosellana]XP_055303630.1 syntaxin-12 [Sitodiplosis mosellana]
MSRGFSNTGNGSGFRGLRDYGATSSSTSGMLPGPSGMSAAGTDVTFAGFSPTEFMSLSESIAQNIASVKSSWQSLEKILKLIGGKKDTVALRDKAHQIQSSANEKVLATKKDLQRLTVVVRHGDKQQKLQVERLTSDFQKVVEIYSACQQQIAAKLKGIILINASQQEDLNNDSNNTGTDTDYLFHQKQKQMQQSLQFEQSMLKDREQRVRQIEEDVLDVNQIMRELNTLINQQGETIDTIENSIDNVGNDVEAGRSELVKAAEYQAKYRRKVIILLLIAVIIGLIVTGLVVSQLK